MADRIYTIKGQVHGFPSIEVTREKYEEAVKRIKLLAEKATNQENVSYDIKNGFFSGHSFIYDGTNIDIGMVKNKHTSKGKDVDLIRISCSDEDLKGIERILFFI